MLYRELDTFISLLTDTLQLPPSAAKDLPETPSGDHVTNMRLGRLNDRIVKLRQELMKGLGEELFYKSRNLLDTGSGDLEETEVRISYCKHFVS